MSIAKLISKIHGDDLFWDMCRLVGYGAFRTFELASRMKPLVEKYGARKVSSAMFELLQHTTWITQLNPHARQAALTPILQQIALREQRIRDLVAAGGNPAEIGTLMLDRPDSLNAMSPELIYELTVASGWLADQAPLRGLIVTGAGERAFSSGGDVNWFKGGLDDPELDLPADVRRGAEVLHQAIVDFRRIQYPVIAAVNGVAAGAGFSLALMCDIRIASDKAVFAESFVKLGIIPGDGGAWLLPRVVGMSKAAEMTFTGDTLSADEAKACGLVSKVVPHDTLLDEAKALAARIAANPITAVRFAKRLMREGQHVRLDTLLELSAAFQSMAVKCPGRFRTRGGAWGIGVMADLSQEGIWSTGRSRRSVTP